MIGNYIITAWRQLIKSKTHSIIKIGGLSVSIAFFLLVMLFIKKEFSFDNFHEDADNIYRLELELDLELAKSRGQHIRLFSNDEEVSKSSRISPGLAPAVKDEIPEVKDYTRYNYSFTLVKVKDNVFQERIVFSDQNFLSFFSFPLIEGEREHALSDLNRCVITDNTAKKLFGNNSPIGKSVYVKLNNKFKEFIVSGITENVPGNSSIDFSILIPIENYAPLNEEQNSFEVLNTSNFIKLSEGADKKSFLDNLELFGRRKLAGVFANGDFDETADPDNRTVEPGVTNLKDIYLHPGIVSNEASANPANAYILSAIALLILIIACTNYISIALAAAAARSHEVGVRKVIGAMKSSVRWQFLVEAMLISLLSTLLGIILAESLLPVFNNLTGADLELTLSTDITTLATALFIGLIAGFLAGIYPAFIMSRFNSVAAINRYRSAKFKTRFTAVLVGFQFAVSSFLITGAVIMSQQMSMVNNYDVGYNPEDIIVIPLYGSQIDGNIIVKRLEKELTELPGIVDITGSSQSFGRGMSMTMLNLNGQQIWSHYYNVDYNFLPMLNIRLLDGRNFTEEFGADNEYSIIINAALAKKTGITEAGSIIPSIVKNRPPYQVIGITSDFNFQSLLHDVNPMFLSLGSEDAKFNYALIKLNSTDRAGIINSIKITWKSIVPDIPFSYTYMEETLENQYSNVVHWQNVVNASAVFAVFIAVLGLFGITGLQAVNKTKEIGIRKVLGAGLKDIVYLVNKNILFTSVTAFILSLPISAIVLQNWLEKFAVRISLTADLFIISAIISLIITAATIAFHSLRAALTNPVETLKAE